MQHPLRFTVLAFSSLCWASVSHAQVSVSSWNGGGESYTDPFDVSQGTVVTGASAQISGSDPRSALGYSNTSFVEPGNTYFADGQPAGTTDFINFTTATPVEIKGFELRTYDDSYSPGNSNRGITRFSLLVSSDGGTTYSTLAAANLKNNYTDNYGTSGILISASFAPITAQYFRIEAMRFNTVAPRIVEFDAKATPAPDALLTTLLGAIPGAGLLLRRRRSAGK